MMTNVRKDEALRVVLTLMSDVTEVHCTCMHIMKLKEDLATAIGSLYVTTVEPLYCMWITWGPGKVSCIERCPHFRGKINCIQKACLGHSVVSLIQSRRCPHFRGVLMAPLYMAIVCNTHNKSLVSLNQVKPVFFVPVAVFSHPSGPI